MKSKSIEALQDLEMTIRTFVCDFKKNYNPCDYEKWLYKTKFEVIQKDLEILEILKRMDWLVYFEEGYKHFWCWWLDIKRRMKITKKEAEIIKEWLNDT